MEVVSHAGSGNRVDNKLEEVMSGAELVSKENREGSGKLLNEK